LLLLRFVPRLVASGIVLALLPVYLNAQAALQITSPSTGTVVNPGQTIQVIVTASQPFTSAPAVEPPKARIDL